MSSQRYLPELKEEAVKHLRFDGAGNESGKIEFISMASY